VTPRPQRTDGRRTLALVALVSAAVLAHEVALLRVLAIAHWHHAAGLIVAVALCGFGAAGTAITVLPWLRTPAVAHVAACLYAVAIPTSLWAASAIEFNALAVGWELDQWARLLALQAVFLAPLFLGALAIQVPLALAGDRIGRVYAVNLAASGVGALGVLPLLGLGPPEEVLRWIALLPALGGALRFPVVGAVAAFCALGAAGARLEMTRYKALPMALAQPRAEVVSTRFLPHARLDVVRAPALRAVDGLSLLSVAEIPPQEIVYADGRTIGARVTGGEAYFRDTLAAVPYAILPEPRVLALGGADDAEAEVAAELRTVDAAWTGENPRAFLETTEERFDIVRLRLSSSVALAEDPLATVEAFGAALDATAPDGCVLVLVPIHTPPREGLRAIATARAVTPHVAAFRSLDLLAVLLRRRASTDAEQEALRDHCAARGFDPIAPGKRVHESGHRAYLAALAGEAASDLYRTAPATDDRPYFHRFLRWSRLPGALGDVRTLGTGRVDWGTLVALAGALQVTLLSVVLVLVPLRRLRGPRSPPPERRFAVLHFLAIGVAYALIEMAFLGRLTQALGSPEYAAGAVLCAFLVASGLGSLTGARIRVGAWAAALLAPAALLVLGDVRSIPAAVAVCAVVAFPMGIPFPGGMRRLDRGGPALVPWALALNGCASVAAFAAAPLLASDVGFSGLVLAGALLYVAVGFGDRLTAAGHSG
jgi:hypothetical protein